MLMLNKISESESESMSSNYLCRLMTLSYLLRLVYPCIRLGARVRERVRERQLYVSAYLTI